MHNIIISKIALTNFHVCSSIRQYKIQPQHQLVIKQFQPNNYTIKIHEENG